MQLEINILILLLKLERIQSKAVHVKNIISINCNCSWKNWKIQEQASSDISFHSDVSFQGLSEFDGSFLFITDRILLEKIYTESYPLEFKHPFWHHNFISLCTDQLKETEGGERGSSFLKSKYSTTLLPKSSFINKLTRPSFCLTKKFLSTFIPIILKNISLHKI